MEVGENAKKIFLLACFFVVAGCATSFDSRGRYHKVQGGETIWKIAGAYRVPVQDLAELNNIDDASKLVVGSKLYIPKRPSGKAWKKLSKREKEPEPQREVGETPIRVDRGRFVWPMDGEIFSGFGIRNGRRHDGIDIAAKAGTAIKAAADGKVAFSGKLAGYGNTVIIRHPDKFFTVYAHNSRNEAKKDEKVKKGDVIARVGSTGRATGPHCHFEIRHGQKARNPLFFLPVKR